MPRVLSGGFWNAVAVGAPGGVYIFSTDPGTGYTQKMYVITSLVAGGGAAVEYTGYQTFVGDESVNFGRGVAAKNLSINTVANAASPLNFEHSGDAWVSHSNSQSLPGLWIYPSLFSNVHTDNSNRDYAYSAYLNQTSTPDPNVPGYYATFDEQLYEYISTNGGSSFTEYNVLDLTAMESTQSWQVMYGGNPYTVTAFTHSSTVRNSPTMNAGGMYVFDSLLVPIAQAFPFGPTSYTPKSYFIRLNNSGGYTARSGNPYWYGVFFTKPGSPDITFHLSAVGLGYVYDWATDSGTTHSIPFTPSDPYPDQFRMGGFTSDGKFFWMQYVSGWKLFRTTDSMVSWSTIDISAVADNSWSSLVIMSDDTLVIPQLDGTVAFSNDFGTTWSTTAAILPDGNSDVTLSLNVQCGF